MHRSRVIACAVASCCASWHSSRAAATDRAWGNGIGTWSTPNHWSPAGTPTTADFLSVTGNGNHEIHFTSNGVGNFLDFYATNERTQLMMGAGYTLTLFGGLYVSDVSDSINKSNIVFINSGGLLNLPTPSVTSLSIGYTDYAELWVSGGSTISSSGYATVGGQDGGRGVFIVQDAGSLVSMPFLTVGDDKSAGGSFARIESNARGNFDGITIGFGDTGPLDSFTVRTGARVDVSNQIWVGAYHGGVLNVSSTLNAGSVYVQNTAGSKLELEGGALTVGWINVTGGTSQLAWTGGDLNITDDNLSIGQNGSLGSLAVPTGGHLHVKGDNTYLWVLPTGSLSASSVAVGGSAAATEQVVVTDATHGTFYSDGNTTISGNTRVGAGGFLQVDGGICRTESLDLGGNSTRLYVNSGALELTASDLIVGTATSFGNYLSLPVAAHIRVTGAQKTITVTDGGEIDAGNVAIGGSIDAVSSLVVSDGSAGRYRQLGGYTFVTTTRVAPAGRLELASGLFYTDTLDLAGAPERLQWTGGSLWLNGGASNTGNLIVPATGTLFASGSMNGNLAVATNGAVTITDAKGRFAVHGTLALADATTFFEATLRGSNGIASTSTMQVDSSAALHGRLYLDWDASLAAITANDRLKILTAASITGHFDSIEGGQQLSQTRWLAVVYGPNAIAVTLAMPGDATLDGTVNFDDLIILAQHYNAVIGDWTTADFNGDGHVNFEDLVPLAQSYGQSQTIAGLMRVPTGDFAADWALAQSLVPEPTTLIGLAASMPFTIRRRR